MNEESDSLYYLKAYIKKPPDYCTFVSCYFHTSRVRDKRVRMHCALTGKAVSGFGDDCLCTDFDFTKKLLEVV